MQTAAGEVGRSGEERRSSPAGHVEVQQAKLNPGSWTTGRSGRGWAEPGGTWTMFLEVEVGSAFLCIHLSIYHLQCLSGPGHGMAVQECGSGSTQPYYTITSTIQSSSTTEEVCLKPHQATSMCPTDRRVHRGSWYALLLYSPSIFWRVI